MAAILSSEAIREDAIRVERRAQRVGSLCLVYPPVAVHYSNATPEGHDLPMDLISFAALACVTLFAATVQAATGFGFALLAVPFFLLVMGSLEAIPVTVAVSIVISLVLIHGLVKDAPRRLLLHLVIGSTLGFPVGLAAFRAADLESVQIAIGALITIFAAFLIMQEWKTATGESLEKNAPRESYRPNAAIEILVGFASGAMAVALAMPGPAVVMYLAVRRAGKQVSRSATLLLFLFSYSAVSLVHTLWGGMTAQSWLLAGKLAPFIIAGALAGNLVSHRLSENNFRKVVLVILIASGLYAIWAAL